MTVAVVLQVAQHGWIVSVLTSPLWFVAIIVPLLVGARHRKAVALVAVVTALSVGPVQASPKVQPTVVIRDPCSVPPISDLPYWERVLLGCG